MKTAIHLLNSIKRGGGENVALNYAKILSELDVKSYFIGKRASADYEKDIADVIEIKEKLDYKTIKNADYIFVHTNKNLLKLFFIYFFSLKFSSKKIFYIQHLNFPPKKFRILSFFINSICTEFIQITPITSVLINKYIIIKKHFIVNFFINKYNDGEYTSIRNQVRGDLDIGEDKTVFMFSGIFKQGKRVEHFVNLARTFQANHNYIFLLLGDGPEAHIVQQYKGENLKWAGMVTDVEKYLISSDVYVFTSLFEMMPMALIEAINTEKKIVAYSTDINKFLLNGETCESFNDLVDRINKSNYPQDLKKYDRIYALSMIREIL